MFVYKCRKRTQKSMAKKEKKYYIHSILKVQDCTTTWTHHHTGLPIKLRSDVTHTSHNTTK